MTIIFKHSATLRAQKFWDFASSETTVPGYKVQGYHNSISRRLIVDQGGGQFPSVLHFDLRSDGDLSKGHCPWLCDPKLEICCLLVLGELGSSPHSPPVKIPNFFFSNPTCFALGCRAGHLIFKENSNTPTIQGTCLRTHYWGQKKKKDEHPAGIKPTTSLLWGMSFTPMLQQLPGIRNLLISMYSLNRWSRSSSSSW